MYLCPALFANTVPNFEIYKNIFFKNFTFDIQNRLTFARPKQKDNNHWEHNPFIFKRFSKNMAHHKSALKRIRQNEKRRLQNRYYKKSARTAIKNLRELKDKTEAEKFLPKVVSMIDRLAKRGNIHKNKAANLKSGLMRHINTMA
jgi:small subunit ribosomal protein S20